ncbi:MAG TPA: protein kinase [Pyrinomonadaceae bacterium]|nr:protein kinase [Pyrinomonadaceae bacterium]
MSSEHWEQVKEIFDCALRRRPEERGEFLNEVCPDNETVRHEVESLLSSFDHADHFMEKPVVGEMAEAVTIKKIVFTKGQYLRHYEISEQIGAGGMGEVYSAHDTRLNRRVALKVLPAASSSDKEANQRLWREARAAATLDHPNICAIHEIAETASCNFIVMQYIEGELLADKLKAGRMSLRAVLSVAVQVADALQEAHRHRIIHRDIKPANIIINERGQAKVLDFGLAKFAENIDAKTKVATAGLSSKSGAIMGTVPYMSPEQVRANRLDARTDIFSFGAMLYEMSCGSQPFARDTDAETISAILRDEPSWADIPAELQPIVQKCLMKNADERYQAAKDLLVDLQNLQKSLEKEAGASISPASLRTSPANGKLTGVQTDTTVTQPRSSAEYLVTEIKRHKLAAAAVIVVLLLAPIAVVFLSHMRKPSAENRVVKSIAILPFKALNEETNNQYLGLGIADSIIAKTSQINGLTVRPTSAVRKYFQGEVDALAAAREQKVDTVLDGTIQQSGDRLRITVNLLNVSDGSSLWAETFNLNFNDIFKMQDEVSRQIAGRLRLKLSEAEAARIARRDSSNAEAYKYYAKAMYHFGNVNAFPDSRPEADLAVDLFKKAIEHDPDYALAHAQLGYTYTKIAVFLEENPAWIELAKRKLAVAERLNPQLAEVHAARYFISFSQYERWQIEIAFRELRLAQEIDPDVAHTELADLYNHVGLEDQAVVEFETALRIDPNSDYTKGSYIHEFYQQNRPDLALELSRRFYNRGPGLQYYLEKMMPKEAEPLIEKELKEDPEMGRIQQIQLLSLQGRHAEAQAAGLEFLNTVLKNRGYHHYTYWIARVFAQGGKSEEALRWLRYTAENGFPCYPLFERDPFLDRIREDPSFKQFMAEMKTRWEGYQREFG